MGLGREWLASVFRSRLRASSTVIANHNVLGHNKLPLRLEKLGWYMLFGQPFSNGRSPTLGIGRNPCLHMSTWYPTINTASSAAHGLPTAPVPPPLPLKVHPITLGSLCILVHITRSQHQHLALRPPPPVRSSSQSAARPLS